MQSAEEIVTYFYADPRPERLHGLIEQYEGAIDQYEELTGEHKWDAYPHLVGFLAVVFSAYPDHIERLLPAKFSPKSATAITVALHLFGAEALLAKLKPKLARVGWDPKLQAEFTGLPARLEEINITTPTHLDIMWGATSASGDSRYVLKIVHFLARTVNRSEQIAVDVFKMTAAMTGGSKEIMKEVRVKYGDARARELVVASTSLWSLRSNALQHPFVKHALDDYAASHSGTLAAIAFSNLCSAGNKK